MGQLGHKFQFISILWYILDPTPGPEKQAWNLKAQNFDLSTEKQAQKF